MSASELRNGSLDPNDTTFAVVGQLSAPLPSNVVAR